jgi:regulator of sirC expression with transglutaminase-like and TPR domain
MLELPDFNLIEAIFWVAAEQYADLDVHREVARMNFLALEAARRVELETNPFARLDGLRVFLFEELGFKGNVHDYHDPRNSYLNEVLNRKVGIPLTLSILFMELARAAGFEATGIGLPGHFVARVSMDGRDLFVDPYHGGRVITEEDCRKLVKRTTGRPLFRREHLDGIDDRATLRRMLLNLKHIYVKRGDYQRALAAVDRLLFVTPEDLIEVRDRGFLQAHLGRPGRAIADLETYLSGSPRAHDTQSVRGRVLLLRRHLSEMN